MSFSGFSNIFTMNILFVLMIKSLASGLSILNFFTIEQVQYFFQVSSLAQLFFFAISLGHTSDKDFSFFNSNQLILSFSRLTVLAVFLLLFDSSSIDYILPAMLFSLLMVFNAFIDFRVKFYQLCIHSLQSFFLVGTFSIVLVIISLNYEFARMFIQVVPFSIYVFFVFYTTRRRKDIWFCNESDNVKLSKLLFVYASLTSLYTFLDRKLIANFGHDYMQTIFFVINFLSLAVFFLDYVFKSKNQSYVKFVAGVSFYNIAALISLFLFIDYRVEVFYVCVSLFQFFFFSLYVIYKNKRVVISLSAFFFCVCLILLCGNYDIISFFNVYMLLYLLQLSISLIFIMSFLFARARALPLNIKGDK
ncbi:conserved membrane hypothetical protein [Vibrio chagasii]|nr:conserved membrane hypothetical protein [Vibrio chagasii]CAH7156052.1 conserved membrane hypothetical protein [Vibrio chagasii]CAH7210017.1 conserved membrane hypothetical protein [Vibrio chagasii]